MRHFRKIFWIGCGLLAGSSAAFAQDTACPPPIGPCKGFYVCYPGPPPRCDFPAEMIVKGLPFESVTSTGKIVHWSPAPGPAPTPATPPAAAPGH